MEPGHYKGLELLLVFGAALGFGVWQLWTLRRDARRARQEAERDAAAGGAQPPPAP